VVVVLVVDWWNGRWVMLVPHCHQSSGSGVGGGLVERPLGDVGTSLASV